MSFYDRASTLQSIYSRDLQLLDEGTTRKEVLREAEQPIAPKDELEHAIKMAESFGWQYVRVPIQVAILAFSILQGSGS